MKIPTFAYSVFAALVCSSIPLTASTIAYDPSANTSGSVNPYKGSVGLVFTVSTDLTVDELGITTNTNLAVNGGAMDSSQLWTQLYRLNDPGGDVSDATLLAERNFTVGLTPTITGIAPWDWNVFFEAPSAPVTLLVGETYVISSTYGSVPDRTMISTPTDVVQGGEITHVASRWGAANAVPVNADGGAVNYAGPTFTYTVVPEPGVTLLGSGALLLALARRRRTGR